jgi:hypothetical protein
MFARTNAINFMTGEKIGEIGERRWVRPLVECRQPFTDEHLHSQRDQK